ncbi:MAG: fluoride efflux transporter CrcB [Nitrosotalea sp.]
MKPLLIVLVVVGGLLGTFLRYKMTASPLLFESLPVNVLIVNVVGSFILGVFAVMSQQWSLDQKYALLIAIGFCGSLTTMSSFALETSNLFESRQLGLVGINILANVGLSIGAIFGGKTLMTVIFQELR